MRRYVLLCFMLIIASGMYIAADVPYDSYLYNRWMEPVDAPHSYVPEAMYRGTDFGISDFSSPNGLFVHKKYQELYIADTGNNRVIRLNSDLEVLNIYEGFAEPSDVFVTDDDKIFIADTLNSRIVVLDFDGNILNEFGTPESDLIPDDFLYYPLKIVVDKADRIYVVSRGVNEGLLELSKDGVFKQFYGAIKVNISPADYAWKMISTQEQRKTMARTVPTVYNNVSIDEDGFVYGTISAYTRWQILDAIYWGGDQVTPIRKLNPGGEDILRREDFFPPVGDIRFVSRESTTPGPSAFCDIAINEIGIYHVLDKRRGRVFTYDPDGKLMSIFGGIGNRKGLLQIPTAIEILSNKILVLDSNTASVTVYTLTEYGKSVSSAIDDYYSGRYISSKENWQDALEKNANLEWAYYGIGNALYREDKFEEAMDYFRIIRNGKPFSRAFKYYRKEVAERYFGWIVAAIIAVFVLYRLLKHFYKKRTEGTIEA